jgi:hypothetical protein
MENNLARLAFAASLAINLILPLHLAEAAESIRVTPKTINMGTVGVNDFENGKKEKRRANILIVTDNVNAWKVMVKTDNNDMGVVGNYTKPISDFLWRATGSYATQTSYTNITNYDVEAARGAKGTNFIVYIDAQVLLSWARDIPGKYNLVVTYTVTTQ